MVGTGISGLSAAWLLSRQHDVTVFEKNARVGGHTNTVTVSTSGGQVAVDTGFIVYNTPAYPNLTALFEYLGIESRETDMTFAVSLDDGRLEYAGTSLNSLFAQPANLFSPRFWSMLRDIKRFYKEAPRDVLSFDEAISIGRYLQSRGYGQAFVNDHLLPMAAAIWSAPAQTLLAYPARSFIAFCENHGLLKITGRPVWRTVRGGSCRYVERLIKPFAERLHTSSGVVSARRDGDSVWLTTSDGNTSRFDDVVFACHADEALEILSDASAAERTLLGSFTYSTNHAVLHSDPSFMPKRRSTWSSWNYTGQADRLSVTYWMNRLQGLNTAEQFFVTLNPAKQLDPALVHHSETYTHPVFDAGTLQAQKQLWDLQGQRNTWFCGAYFGSGFHEDGLQAGLAVAEALGGVRRPWTVADPSGRIYLAPDAALEPLPQGVPA